MLFLHAEVPSRRQPLLSTCQGRDPAEPPPPSPPPAQTHPGSRETWAIPHRADEVLNLHVTQAELQNAAACPSYQMTWNSARSSAVTAGSLTRGGTPARLLNRSQRRQPRDPARAPSERRRAAPIPLGWHGLKTSPLLLWILHADSFRYVIWFSPVSLKRDFRDLALQSGEK